MGGAKTLSIIVAANIKGLETSMARANKSIGSFASNAARLGSLLTFGVTAPLAALGKTALNTFVDFEDGMMKVKAVTGATDREFQMLNENAKELGKTTRFTSQQFADLQLVLGRKGFNPKAIQDMTSSISKLALATGSDLSLAAEVVASSINAFNLESTEAASVANTLASAAANSSIELGTFSTAFGHAGASANAVGIDLQELAAMMGVLMDNGIKASKAGTGLRKIFMKLHKEGRNFTEVLDLATQGQVGLEKAMKLAGVTSASQLLILANNKDKVAELTSSYRTNTTELDRMSSMMGETSKNKIEIMNSAINAMNLEFGALVAESLTPMINKITELSEKFAELEPEIKNQIIQFGFFAAIVGPLSLALSLIVSSITTLIGFFKTGITYVVAFVAGFGELYAAILLIIEGNAILASLALMGTGGWIALAAVVVGFTTVLYKLITGFSNATDEQNNFMLSTKATNDALDEQEKKFSIRALVLADIAAAQKKATEDQLKLEKKLEEQRLKGFKAIRELPNDIIELDSVDTSKLQKAGEIIRDAANELKGLLTQLETVERVANATKEAVTNIGIEIARGFTNGFAELFVRVRDSEGAILSFEEKFKKFANGFLTQLGVMILQASIFAAILSLIFPAASLGGKGTGLAGFGTNFLDLMQGGSGLKGFADGGRPPLNRMSLVGENGPELFNPGSQSGTIIPNHAMGGTTIPDVRISGNDLLIVFDRAKRIKNRR